MNEELSKKVAVAVSNKLSLYGRALDKLDDIDLICNTLLDTGSSLDIPVVPEIDRIKTDCNRLYVKYAEALSQLAVGAGIAPKGCASDEARELSVQFLKDLGV